MADEFRGSARAPAPSSLTSGRASRYLEAYLRVEPVALAAWRSAEAKHFGSLSLERPILDLGCGFGGFGRAFFEEPADVGLDISGRDLRICAGAGTHRSLVQADAHRLPFAANTFGTVMSVSVLEHIPDVQRVFAEARRVLRPGGTFAFSVPLSDLDRYMFYPPLLRRVGLARLADAYVRRVHAVFKHANLLEPEAWTALATEAGFDVQTQRRVISRAVTRVFDVGLPTASLSEVGRLLTGRRFVWRPAPLVALWRRLLLPHVEADEAEGSNLFIVARKPPARRVE